MKVKGFSLAPQCNDQRVGNDQEGQQQDHRDHHIDQRGLEVIDAVDGEGTGQQYKDCKGGKVADNEVQEHDHHIIDLAQQAAQARGATLAQGVHAQAGGHCQEHAGKHSAIAAKGSDDVGGMMFSTTFRGLEPVEPAASVRPSM